LDLFDRSIAASTVEERAKDVSISGVQPKVSATMISFPINVWKRGPSLLKLDPAEYQGLVRNEHFFLTAAHYSGLKTPEHAIVHDRDGNEGLLVKRFDRVVKRGASVGRIHQEDGCQLLDRYPSEKYRISTSVLVEALCNVVSAPIVETLSFLRLVAFSYLIGNGDLHAKNVSVATDPKTGRIRLTPAYDLVSTAPFGDTKMALDFEGRTDNISRSDFIAFGARFDLRAPAVEAMLDEVLAATTVWRPRLKELDLPAKRFQQLSMLIDKRSSDLAQKRITVLSS
jgi:serine/threonine-protein kinase HipA